MHEDHRYASALDILDDIEDVTGYSIQIVEAVRDDAGELMSVCLSTEGFSSLLSLAEIDTDSVQARREESAELDYFLLDMEVFEDLLARVAENEVL